MQRTTVYDLSRPGTVDLTDTGFAVLTKYPNMIYPGYQLKPSKDVHDPVTIVYCPVCQKLAETDPQFVCSR